MNCLIIGGTSGIGLETAKIFKKKGYQVVVCGRKKNRKIVFNFLKVDVTKEASVKSLFNNILFDKIDSLVYSAGQTISKKKITEFNYANYKKIHDVNLLGAIYILKYSYKKLKKAKGKVTIINSMASKKSSLLSGLEYTVSKSGLSGLVKHLSLEWASDKIFINSVYPSMTKTRMLPRNRDYKKIIELIPLKKLALPNDIAKAIYFLNSEDNQYITGSGIDINGGQYLSG